MNLEFLHNHVESRKDSVKVESFSKENKERFFMPDVPLNKSFVRNHAGYPRSEVAQIREQQNEQVALAMLSQLSEVPASYQSADLSDETIMMAHRSKYCQTPSEMLSHIENQLEARRQQVIAEHAKQENPSVEKETPSDIIDKV